MFFFLVSAFFFAYHRYSVLQTAEILMMVTHLWYLVHYIHTVVATIQLRDHPLLLCPVTLHREGEAGSLRASQPSNHVPPVFACFYVPVCVYENMLTYT